MVSRLRSWWQKTSKPRLVLIFTLFVILLVLLLGGYFFNWTWTGFGPYTLPNSNFQREKTLYDWLQLAIIPVALAFGVWWLNRLQQQRDQQLADQRAQTEREIATDNQCEAALQDYINNMSALLLEPKKLRESQPDDEVRTIARTRTLTILSRLNPNRKRTILQFLHESRLIHKDTHIINTGETDLTGAYLSRLNLFMTNLSGANLSGADMSKVNLYEVNLFAANLTGTNLSEAYMPKVNLNTVDLQGANLTRAYLPEADLLGAKLKGADLSEANLKDIINITVEKLEKEAKSLKGTTMPDGSKHP